MNIIFLDIDGVLNDADFFEEKKIKCELLWTEFSKSDRLNNIEYIILSKKTELDLSKMLLLKNIVDMTDAKIVFVSAWINTRSFLLVEEYFTSLGIPIEGTIEPYLIGKRGLGIKKYIAEHKVNNYIIIDDEIFDTYDDELKEYLIRTNFYNGGLQEEHADEAIYRLRKK